MFWRSGGVAWMFAALLLGQVRASAGDGVVPFPTVEASMSDAGNGMVNVRIRGALPYTWTLYYGQVPPGLELPTSGVISGTPRVLGMFAATLKVTESGGAFRTAYLPITVRVLGYGFSLDQNPGRNCQGGWAFGIPTAGAKVGQHVIVTGASSGFLQSGIFTRMIRATDIRLTN